MPKKLRMDISITAPRTRSLIGDAESFVEWKKIIKDKSQPYIYFRLACLPAQDRNCHRCFVIYKGHIRGCFKIKAFMNVLKGSEDMLRGRYVMLITNSWRDIKPIKARGHRNFRYIENIEFIREKGKNLLIQMYEELERRCQR